MCQFWFVTSVQIFHLSFFKASVFCTVTGVSRANVVSKWGKQQLFCKNTIERWPFSFHVQYLHAIIWCLVAPLIILLQTGAAYACIVCVFNIRCSVPMWKSLIANNGHMQSIYKCVLNVCVIVYIYVCVYTCNCVYVCVCSMFSSLVKKSRCEQWPHAEVQVCVGAYRSQ